MFTISLKMTGLEEAIQGVEAAEKLLKTNVEEALTWFGDTVTKEAKEDHPYQDRTGNLTKSITYIISTWVGNSASIVVTATMDYAAAVEYGTAHSRAYPFLFPKFYAHLDELYIRLQAAVDAAIRQGGVIGGARV